MSSDQFPVASPDNRANFAPISGELPPLLNAAVGRRDDETILRIEGEVDLSTAAQFSAALTVGLTVGSGTLVVDLREVSFIDGRGLGTLTQAARQASAASGTLYVVPGAALGHLAALLGGWADVPGRVVMPRAEQRRRGSTLTIGIDEPSRGAFQLRPDGEVDVVTVELFGDVINAALVDAGTGRVASVPVVVELDRVRFMSAAGAAVLARAHSRASAAGVPFRLAGGIPVVRRLLDITGVTAAVEHYDSVAHALDPRRPRLQTARGERAATRHRDDYAHLARLFTERQRLPADHPRQRVLRAELITGYLPVARHIALKHRYRGENLDDLEQVATIGLINAVDRFEPERGYDFLTFAIPTMNGEVQRHYRDRTSMIRIPRPIRELQPRVYRAADELSHELGRAATPSELARHLDVDLDAVIEALQAAYEIRHSSLDEPQRGDDTGSGEGRRFSDVLGVADPQLDLVETRESLAPLLDGLPERERRIVLLRFYGNMTQTEIGERMGISQMHVSRLLASILARLRRELLGG